MNPALEFPESQERLITSQAVLDELRNGIDGIDAEILAAVVRRTELSRRIAAVVRDCGGTGTQYKRDLAVIHRFGVLGKEGHSLGRLLIRLAHPRHHADLPPQPE